MFVTSSGSSELFEGPRKSEKIEDLVATIESDYQTRRAGRTEGTQSAIYQPQRRGEAGRARK